MESYDEVDDETHLPRRSLLDETLLILKAYHFINSYPKTDYSRDFHSLAVRTIKGPLDVKIFVCGRGVHLYRWCAAVCLVVQLWSGQGGT